MAPGVVRARARARVRVRVRVRGGTHRPGTRRGRIVG